MRVARYMREPSQSIGVGKGVGAQSASNSIEPDVSDDGSASVDERDDGDARWLSPLQGDDGGNARKEKVVEKG